MFFLKQKDKDILLKIASLLGDFDYFAIARHNERNIFVFSKEAMLCVFNRLRCFDIITTNFHQRYSTTVSKYRIFMLEDAVLGSPKCGTSFVQLHIFTKAYNQLNV